MKFSEFCGEARRVARDVKERARVALSLLGIEAAILVCAVFVLAVAAGFAEV